MLFTLRPLILESQGLTAALQSMSDKMMETYGQKVTIDMDEQGYHSTGNGQAGR